MYWVPALLILPYVILLLKNYRSLIRTETFIVTADPVTFVSVVVACRNEQKRLPALLDSIALQNYPEHSFEVIIVNDKSTDKTTDISEGFTGIRNIHTIDNKGEGKKQALRTGIMAAKGNLIMTTDADCIMGMNWIRTVTAFYEMKKPDMIICPVQLEPVHRILGKLQELEFMSLQGITAGTTIAEEATMCNGANLAFTREAYLKNSDNLHYEINSGDDIFLLHSIKKDKYSKILWLESPDAMVTTESSPTFSSLLEQRRRWISKGTVYKDRNTIALGIVTFTAIILQISYLIAGLTDPALFRVFISIIIMKSLPDFLILLNTSGRYAKRKLMWWFLPVQLIYPLYVLSIVIYSIIFRNK